MGQFVPLWKYIKPKVNYWQRFYFIDKEIKFGVRTPPIGYNQLLLGNAVKSFHVNLIY